MSTVENRQFKLIARPKGMVKRSDFEFTTAPAGEPGPGEVLVKVLYLSLDPAMRGWMNECKSYIAPVGLGEVMRAGGVGRVMASNDPGLAVGDFAVGMTGMQDYALVKAKAAAKVDPRLAPLPRYLGALGTPGLTAYFGLLDIGQPKEGETVVVSAAAGAVGAVVGQIARIKGCRVVGIAGGPEKCLYLTRELGFDAAIDYKNEDLRAGLSQHCPKGIDVYFDNVGGAITDAVIPRLNVRGRVAVCGQISQYNSDEPEIGPRWLGQLIYKQAKVEGFQVKQFASRFEEGYRQLATWLHDKKIQYREDVVTGLENAPRAFIGMLQGQNIGKQLVKLAQARQPRG